MNTTIANRHKLEDIVSTRLKLEKAAGCATKTVAYWGPRLLSLLDQLSASITNAGDLQAPSSGAPVPTQKAFEYTVFQCHLAYNADEKTKSAVTDAADDACYAMNYLLDHKVLDACHTLDKSITKAVSMGANDPLAGEAKGLSLKLAQRFGSLNCGTVIATAKVAEDQAKAAAAAAAQASAPSQPAPNPYAKRNDIVHAINGEMQSLSNSFDVAKLWFDRGDEFEACGYYQKVLNSYRTLETLYGDLYLESREPQYRDQSFDMKDEQANALEAYGDECKEAGRQLY